MGKPYQIASAPNTSITRGGTAYTALPASPLPDGGYDLGDGTAAKMVYLAGGAFNSSASSITPVRATIAANAAAVPITSTAPASTRFSVTIQNSGGNPMWIGPQGVDNTTGFPVQSGATVTFPLGPRVELYGFSTAGTTSAALEFS